MRVCVCVCAHTCAHVCVCRCVSVVCVVVSGDRCIPLTMLVDVCKSCRLLMFVYLPLFKTLSLLLNLVNKESESEN